MPPFALITTLSILHILTYTAAGAAYEPTNILGPHQHALVWRVCCFVVRFVLSFKACVCVCVYVWYVRMIPSMCQWMPEEGIRCPWS